MSTKARVRDPICGIEVHPAPAAKRRGREGVDYYQSCSADCAEGFDGQSPSAGPMERPTYTLAGLDCAASVERSLGVVPGVGRVAADLGRRTVTVEYEPAHLPEARLRQAIEGAGFAVTGAAEEPGDAEDAAREREYRTLVGKFGFAATISVPVVLLSSHCLVPGMRDLGWLARGSDGLLWAWRPLGLLTLPVMVRSGNQPTARYRTSPGRHGCAGSRPIG